jgi:hypothetical protein
MEVAVAGDTEHPEYKQCLKLARLLALATGFRTCKKCGGEHDLPNDRTLLLEAYDEYTSKKLENATVQPSMLDVANAQDTVMRRVAEDKNHRDKVEDLRGVKIPRNNLVPEYKQVPQTPDELMRP